MKTKLMKYVGMAVLLTAITGLTSCEIAVEEWYDDDHYEEIYYRTTRELCSRTWQETWTQDGEIHTQRLDFYEDGRGTDILRMECRNGYITEDRYEFKWKWDNRTQTCIRMSYGPGDYSYLEAVSIGNNTLRGILDGTDVYFTGIR